MTIECPKKIEKLLKSYYGDDFRLDMNLVSLEKTKEGYSGVARFDYYVFNALFGGDLESEFYRFTITDDKKIADEFILQTPSQTDGMSLPNPTRQPSLK